MTGPEHYAEAERWLRVINEGAQRLEPVVGTGVDISDSVASMQLAAACAQVHATLALTAATAMHPAGLAPDGDTARDWRRTILPADRGKWGTEPVS